MEITESNQPTKRKTENIKWLAIVVGSLILLRILSVLLTYYLPNLEEYRYNNYLLASYTGDDKGYHALAKMIYNFEFYKHDWTLGFPITITPFILLFGTDFQDVFFPIVLLNSLFLYSLSITLIVLTAFLIFQKIKTSFLAGLIFVLFPFLFYVFRNFGPHFEAGNWNDFNFFHANWLTMMSDPLSSLLVYLILFLVILNVKKIINAMYFYPLVGFLSGYAMMTRVSNITIIFSILVLFFLFEKKERLKKFLFFLSSLTIGFLPQLIYNYKILGSPFSFGYQGAYQEWISMGAATRPTFSIGNIIHIISRAVEYSWLSIPVMLMLIAIVFIGVLYVSKIKKEYAVILILWFLMPVLFYASFTTGQTSARYYLPAVQPLIILFMAAFYFLMEIALPEKKQQHE